MHIVVSSALVAEAPTPCSRRCRTRKAPARQRPTSARTPGAQHQFRIMCISMIMTGTVSSSISSSSSSSIIIVIIIIRIAIIMIIVTYHCY